MLATKTVAPFCTRPQTTLRGTKKSLHGLRLQETLNARLMGRGEIRRFDVTTRFVVNFSVGSRHTELSRTVMCSFSEQIEHHAGDIGPYSPSLSGGRKFSMTQSSSVFFLAVNAICRPLG